MTIIIFFLITNIPENLVSRTAAINLLFQGDHDRANTVTLERLRQICTLLAAIDVNTNFFFYYTFCPAFCKALKRHLCKCMKRRASNNLQVIFHLGNLRDFQGFSVSGERVCAQWYEIEPVGGGKVQSKH